MAVAHRILDRAFAFGPNQIESNRIDILVLAWLATRFAVTVLLLAEGDCEAISRPIVTRIVSGHLT